MNPPPGGECEVVREPKEAELLGYIFHSLEILCVEIDSQALGDPVGSPSGRGQIAMGSAIRVLGGGLSRGRIAVSVCLCSFLNHSWAGRHGVLQLALQLHHEHVPAPNYFPIDTGVLLSKQQVLDI